MQKWSDLDKALTTGAVSLRFRKMWQVKVDTMAMVDTMGARAEFPLWTYPAFFSKFFSLFLISAKEKAIGGDLILHSKS